MRDEQTFGFCPDCGRALPEMTEDGRCENRVACESRARFASEEELIDSARREAMGLWFRAACDPPHAALLLQASA